MLQSDVRSCKFRSELAVTEVTDEAVDSCKVPCRVWVFWLVWIEEYACKARRRILLEVETEAEIACLSLLSAGSVMRTVLNRENNK